MHTGDITHLAKPDQFDTVAEILNEVKTETGKVFYVPGEHDFEVDGNREYLKRYGKNMRGRMAELRLQGNSFCWIGERGSARNQAAAMAASA